MKSFITTTLVICLTTLFLAITPTDAEAKIYEDTLRLHILANSDSDEDQALKLEIRNLLLEKYSEALKAFDSIESTVNNVRYMIDEMEMSVAGWICERGYEYSVNITLTEEWYDTREYEDFTLPKGIYTSLRVIIGEGKGKNWWCVMYPPLCLDLACESAPKDDGIINYSYEEIKLIRGNEYKIKFKVLELLSDAFAKNG